MIFKRSLLHLVWRRRQRFYASLNTGGSIRKASLFFGGGLGIIVAGVVVAGTEEVAAVVVVPVEVF